MRSTLSAALAAILLVAACTDQATETTSPPRDTIAVPSTTATTSLPTSDAPAPGGLDLVAATVIDVPDGDSLLVEMPDGTEERVRLTGINAPERDECLGDEARAHLEAIAGGDVVLGLEDEARDQFDRLLAHVFVGNGYINRAQVELGFALALSQPNAFAADLAGAEELAKIDMIGLWSPDSCGGGPIPDIEIVEIEPNPPGPDEDALDLEIVTIENAGTETVDLSGWILRDESTANRFVFPSGTELGPGKRLEVSSGCAADGNRMAWCADGPIWNNSGDSALLLDASGRVVDHLGY